MTNKETKQTKSITQDELQAAIRKFKENGGIIQKLPDQKTFNSQAVGMRWTNVESGEIVNS